MTLEPGDTWKGLDTLRVVDEHGNVVTEGNIVMDMDIDPDAGVITMTVSGDIG